MRPRAARMCLLASLLAGLLVGSRGEARAGAAVAVAPVATTTKPPSAAAEAAETVLREKEQAEELAMREAVEADLPSRERNDDGNISDGFKSWSQLYQVRFRSTCVLSLACSGTSSYQEER